MNGDLCSLRTHWSGSLIELMHTECVDWSVRLLLLRLLFFFNFLFLLLLSLLSNYSRESGGRSEALRIKHLFVLTHLFDLVNQVLVLIVINDHGFVEVVPLSELTLRRSVI